MKVTFNGINNIPSVFNDVSSQKYTGYNSIPAAKTDVVEIKSKKQPFYKNKKLIFAVLLMSAAALAILYSSKCKKGADNAKEALKQYQALPKYLAIQQDETLVKKVNIAREHLIDEVQEQGTTLFNGVSFFGPESANKTTVKEGFIKELSKAGYQIERMPELQNSSIEDIGYQIDKAIKEAKNRFETQGKRTAIIIKELDKIAPDRQETKIYKAARPLLNYMQDCSKKGFTVVADEYNVLKVDTAVARPGRFSLHILTKPLENEPKEVWQKYIDFIKEYANKNEQEALINEALKVISKK